MTQILAFLRMKYTCGEEDKRWLADKSGCCGHDQTTTIFPLQKVTSPIATASLDCQYHKPGQDTQQGYIIGGSISPKDVST